MAENNSNYNAVTIWHPSGAKNVVYDFELPYWTSQVGGSWSLTPPGSQASQAQIAAQPTQVQSPTGNTIQVIPGNEFMTQPITPAGVPVQRNDQGRYSLIYFSSDPTPNDPQTGKSYWIFDSADRTYRPITDYVQLDNFIKANGGSGAQEALRLAINLDPASISDQSLGWDGVFLGVDFSPSDDGSLPYYNNPNLVSDAITKKYGSTTRNYSEEVSNEQRIRQVFNLMAANGTISQDMLAKIEDPRGTLLAKYVSATTYGGYGIGEVWQDLKIQELATTNPAYSNLTAVSNTMKLPEFMNTSQYAEVLADPNLQKPIDAFSDGSYLMNTPLGRVDDSFFQELTPTFDWTSPANQDKVNEIQAAWYDLALAQSQAGTEQKKAIADNNFKTFISNLNKNFGLNLSNNAKTAWGQLQTLFGNTEKAGLSGSGIEREAQDRILADIRRVDENLKANKLTDENAQIRNYLLNYADEQQMSDIISRMDEEDAASGLSPDQYRSATWGLTPSAETLAWFDPAALAERFPDLSSDEIELLRGQLLDSNNRYRSNLYSTALSDQFNIGRSKQTFQQQELMARAANDAANASQQFESSLSSYVPPETLTSPDVQAPTQTAQQTTPALTPGPSTNNTVNMMLAEAERQRRAGTLGQNGGVTAASVTQPSYTPPTQTNTVQYTPPTQTNTSSSSQSGQSSQASAPSPTSYVTLRHTSGGEQRVLQADYDSYWKNQSGWSKIS